MEDLKKYQELAKYLRILILKATTSAGSGHATSSLSAVELMAILFFKYFRSNLDDPQNSGNDRLIFSKGHASPLFYSLYTLAGYLSEKELFGLRKISSVLEGHPTMRFPYTETATGSLGQGLSVGLGMALGMKNPLLENSPSPSLAKRGNNMQQNGELPPLGKRGSGGVLLSRIFVLLGDGEMAEGQVWEAIETAAYYKLNNLVAIIDVNRLGQSQQTMLGDEVQVYAKRVAAFGWRTYVINDGHDLDLIDKAFLMALEQGKTSDKPAAIIAKTVKGKGVSFLEDKNGWHGIALSDEQLKQALKELGDVDKVCVQSFNFIQDKLIASNIQLRNSPSPLPAQAGSLAKRGSIGFEKEENGEVPPLNKRGSGGVLLKYKVDDKVATRKAFGEALVNLGEADERIIVLDGDVQNSTYTKLFAEKYPERFLQMFIAEQNMVSVAVGLSRLGFKPVVSTFAAFLTRGFDQIRMAALSNANIIFNGSHAGVSIGEDGPSQMGLEDISLFRSVPGSIILYPADAVATEQLLFQADGQKGIVYFRTTRPQTKILYKNSEQFKIGGSKLHKCQMPNAKCQITIIAAGITVYEALKAQKELAKEKIGVTVIDCYSVKPIDKETLVKVATESKLLITVEDHYPQGGLGDAVLEALAETSHPPIIKLAVNKTPRSGTTEELLCYEEIDAEAVVKKIKELSDR